MGNEIVDEVEGQLDKILNKKYPKLAKNIEDEKIYLDYGNPNINEHSTRDSLRVNIIETGTNKVAGKINFVVKIVWSNGLTFGGWDEIKIMPSTVNVEYENDD